MYNSCGTHFLDNVNWCYFVSHGSHTEFLMLKEATMPAVQVRDFPEDLYERFKAQAERDHRSVAAELIYAAERVLEDAERKKTANKAVETLTAGSPLHEQRQQRNTLTVEDIVMGRYIETAEEKAERIKRRRALLAEIHEFQKTISQEAKDALPRIMQESKEELESRGDEFIQEYASNITKKAGA